jgi:Family of unknown function (DUF6206)
MPVMVPDAEMRTLEARVQQALASGDSSMLDIVGYGEVTLVLRLVTAGAGFACKRLPYFPDELAFGRYHQLLENYIERLDGAGVRVADTSLWHQRLPSGHVVAYCVQPELPAARLCSRLMRHADEAWTRDFAKRFLDTVDRAVTPVLGLDAQAANWMDVDGELVYLDVTTPLMRDRHGRELLDARLFFASLPWLVRDAVRLTMSRSIFDKFYSARGVILDFLGNLHKEGLGHLVPGLAAQASERLAKPVSAEEAAAYYRSDARTWEVVQRLRRADRTWQRRIRHRTYPFLLPPPISR